jgi:acetyltransferase EpsM
MENKKLYIFGASGHGKVIAELLASNNCVVEAFIDDAPKNDFWHAIPICNTLASIKRTDNVALIIAIGDNLIRKRSSFRFQDFPFFTSIHPTAIVSPTASIGLGTVVLVNAIINSDAVLGDHVIINTAVVIEHDCRIADFVHISPNATLSGNVSVGEGTHIGVGVVVIPGVKIGKWCTIGAGTVLLNDVPDGATVVGNPGRIIKYNTDFDILKMAVN